MNTTPALADTQPLSGTFRPINLGQSAWVEQGRKAMFSSPRRCFGVQEVATGRVLSKDGVRPSAWTTKAIAAVIAATPPAWPLVKLVQK